MQRGGALSIEERSLLIPGGEHWPRGRRESPCFFKNDLCFIFLAICYQMQPPSLPISSMRWTVWYVPARWYFQFFFYVCISFYLPASLVWVLDVFSFWRCELQTVVLCCAPGSYAPGSVFPYYYMYPARVFMLTLCNVPLVCTKRYIIVNVYCNSFLVWSSRPRPHQQNLVS